MPKKTLIITAIIVAVIAVGATATYITVRQALNQEGTGQGGKEVRQEQPVVTLPGPPELPVVPPQQPVTPAEEPTTTEPIDTSDWKTYRNEKYGFELKYPEIWQINRFDDTEGASLIKEGPSKTIAINLAEGSVHQKGISLWDFADAYWENIESHYGTQKCEWIRTDSGVSGVKCRYKIIIYSKDPTKPPSEPFEKESPPFVFFETNPPSVKRVVIIAPEEIIYNPDPNFNLDIFETIVRTFKLNM